MDLLVGHISFQKARTTWPVHRPRTRIGPCRAVTVNLLRQIQPQIDITDRTATFSDTIVLGKPRVAAGFAIHNL